MVQSTHLCRWWAAVHGVAHDTQGDPAWGLFAPTNMRFWITRPTHVVSKFVPVPLPRAVRHELLPPFPHKLATISMRPPQTCLRKAPAVVLQPLARLLGSFALLHVLFAVPTVLPPRTDDPSPYGGA